jgi:Ser/Thr protein kinase RdoA (MazF antagonist)
MAAVDDNPMGSLFALLTEDRVLHDLLRYYNLSGQLKQLGSCQDINYRLIATDSQKYVVKYLNESITSDDIRFQHQILDYLKAFPTHRYVFPYPLKRTDTNSTIVELIDPHGRKYHMCILTYIDGDLLSEFKYLHSSALTEIGSDIASSSLMLKGFPLSDDYKRTCEWDMRKAYDICDQRKAAVKDANYQSKLMTMALKNYEVVLHYDNSLRHQLVHGDLADYNIIAEKGSLGRPKIKGIIDFGDVVESWLVGDLAICIVTLLSRKNQNLMSMIIPIIQGFCSVNQLNESELRCLWHLILLRATLLYINVSHILEKDPTNQYLLEEQDSNYTVLETLLEVPLQYAVSTILFAGGLFSNPSSSITQIAMKDYHSLVEKSDTSGHFAENAVSIDVSFANPLYMNGNWEDDPEILSKIIKQTIVEGLRDEPVGTHHGRKRASTRLLQTITRPLSMTKNLLSPPGETTHQSSASSSAPEKIFEIKMGSSWFTNSEVRCLESPKSISTFSVFYLPKGCKMFSPWNGKARLCDDSSNMEFLFHDLKAEGHKETNRIVSFGSPKVLEITNEEYTLLVYGIHVVSPMTLESSWNIHRGK